MSAAPVVLEPHAGRRPLGQQRAPGEVVDHRADVVVAARGGAGQLVGGDRTERPGGEVCGGAHPAGGGSASRSWGQPGPPGPPRVLYFRDSLRVPAAEPTGDSRGILQPRAGAAAFSMVRHHPSARLAPFVDYLWSVEWDRTGRPAHVQRVLPNPAVHLSFEPGLTRVTGLARRRAVFEYRLTGAGRVVGVRFRRRAAVAGRAGVGVHRPGGAGRRAGAAGRRHTERSRAGSARRGGCRRAGGRRPGAAGSPARPDGRPGGQAGRRRPARPLDPPGRPPGGPGGAGRAQPAAVVCRVGGRGPDLAGAMRPAARGRGPCRRRSGGVVGAGHRAGLRRPVAPGAQLARAIGEPPARYARSVAGGERPWRPAASRDRRPSARPGSRFAQPPVGGHHEQVAITVGQFVGDGGQGVVAAAPGPDHPDARGGAGTSRAWPFDDRDQRGDPHGRAVRPGELGAGQAARRSSSRRWRPAVAPPAVGAGADGVGDVDDQHRHRSTGISVRRERGGQHRGAGRRAGPTTASQNRPFTTQPMTVSATQTANSTRTSKQEGAHCRR